MTPKEMLARYIQAEADVLEGKSVTFAGRQLTMVDLKDIRAGRQEWERRVASLPGASGCRPQGYSLATFE